MKHHRVCMIQNKQQRSLWREPEEPGLIASDFFQTFWDFGIQKEVHIFLITPGEFYSWKKCSVWKILMKIWLVMVSIIKFIKWCVCNCNIFGNTSCGLYIYIKSDISVNSV